jgi:Putative transmembrane protein (PGPGW)
MARKIQTDEGPTEVLGDPVAVPRGGWRDRMRSKRGTRELYRGGVFVAGLLFILLGVAFIALPGPLTIPPMLVGLWIWSTEFAFAERLFDSFQDKARDAWAHARQRPVSSGAVTGGGLVGAVVAFWAVSHYGLVEQAKTALL